MPEVKEKLQISFYTRGTEFNGNTIKFKGLGGSESALFYLSRELGKRGHVVNVFCSCDKPGLYDGVSYHRSEDFVAYCGARPQDICVFSRLVETITGSKARAKILWLHDIASIQYYKDHLPELDSLIDRYFLISKWQQRGFEDTFDFTSSKLHLTRNGIDLTLFAGPWARNRNKLVYINTPFRGLDVLVHLFPRIRRFVPEAELYLYTGMSIYGDQFSEMEQQLQALYTIARRTPGIVLREPLPKAALAGELMTARLALYPSHFPECCSIASLETQAAGTPMITSALAGLNDTIIDGETGILIPIDDPVLRSRSGKYQAEFLNQTVRLLNDDAAWETLSNNAMKQMAAHYSWKAISMEWENEFHAVLKNKPD